MVSGPSGLPYVLVGGTRLNDRNKSLDCMVSYIFLGIYFKTRTLLGVRNVQNSTWTSRWEWKRERYGKFQNIYIFGVGSFSAFNIAINFNREVFMIMILFSIFFMKNSFNWRSTAGCT